MPGVTPYKRYGEPAPETDARLTVHIIVAGDTLTALAFRYYRNLEKWTLIADRNGIVDARRELVPGKKLIIPGPELEKGRYESE